MKALPHTDFILNHTFNYGEELVYTFGLRRLTGRFTEFYERNWGVL